AYLHCSFRPCGRRQSVSAQTVIRGGTTMPTPSMRLGIGAMPYPEGVTFRVWAPFANVVHVAGEFNGWNSEATPLAAEGNEHWSVDVPGTRTGQKYKFIVGGPWQIDPRAKLVTHSIGDGIIVDASYAWRVNNFGMPPWNELVIYEMHVATFPDNPVQV